MKRVGRLRPGELRVDIRRMESTWTIALAGELDRFTVPELRHELERAAPRMRSPVVLDLTQCSFVDAAGLDALVAADTILGVSDERLALVAPRFVAHLLARTGLDTRFAVTVSELDGGTAQR